MNEKNPLFWVPPRQVGPLPPHRPPTVRHCRFVDIIHEIYCGGSHFLQGRSMRLELQTNDLIICDTIIVTRSLDDSVATETTRRFAVLVSRSVNQEVATSGSSRLSSWAKNYTKATLECNVMWFFYKFKLFLLPTADNNHKSHIGTHFLTSHTLANTDCEKAMMLHSFVPWSQDLG